MILNVLSHPEVASLSFIPSCFAETIHSSVDNKLFYYSWLEKLFPMKSVDPKNKNRSSGVVAYLASRNKEGVLSRCRGGCYFVFFPVDEQHYFVGVGRQGFSIYTAVRSPEKLPGADCYAHDFHETIDELVKHLRSKGYIVEVTETLQE